MSYSLSVWSYSAFMLGEASTDSDEDSGKLHTGKKGKRDRGAN